MLPDLTKEISKFFNKIYKDYQDFKLILLENLNKTKIFDENYIKNSLNIIEWWLKENISSKKSIFIFGKTSSGKSRFINKLFEENGKFEILPTSTKTESRIIIKIEHTDKEPYSLIKLSDGFPADLPGKFRKYYNSDENFLRIPLKEEDIESFHEFIKLNSFDPLNYIDSANPLDKSRSVSIFYPFKNRFRDYIFFDTPGLGSAFSDTDKDVYNSFLYHSIIIWCIKGNEPQMSDQIKLIAENREQLKQIKPNRLIFLSTHYDILLGTRLREIKSNQDLKTKEAKKLLLNKAKQKIIDSLKTNDIEKFLSFNFIDLKRNKDNTQENSFFEIEEKISSKMKSIEIDMLMDLNNTISNFLKNILNKISKKIKEFENEINEIKDNISNFKNENKINQKNEIEQKEKAIEEIYKTIKNEINNKCKLVLDCTNKNSFNKQLDELSKYVKNINNELYRHYNDIDQTLLENIDIDLTKYRIKKQIDYLSDALNNWFIIKPKRKKFKNGLDSEVLKEFKVKEKLKRNIERIKEYYINNIKSTYNDKINGYIREKQKEIEAINKEKRLLESVENQIKEKDSLSKDLIFFIKKSLAQEIENWKDPAKYTNKETKIISFLKLYRYIRYYEEIEKMEKENGKIA